MGINGPQEIGMIGFNPHTGRPLNTGVTIQVTKNNIVQDKNGGNQLSNDHNDNSNNNIQIAVQGQQCFEVQGEPYLDETSSFYKANIEIIDHREEMLTPDEKIKVKELSKTIPSMVSKWIKEVMKSKKTDTKGINILMKDIGPMPKTNQVKELALWVGALLNPIPALNVCLEIRPAMLSCRNDHDRMILTCAALQSSIDHLSGK